MHALNLRPRINVQYLERSAYGHCRESGAINASLMTLGRCLEALHWNQTHPGAAPRLVPFRESKITHLFRDALHGWGRILLSVNVSPAAQDYDETSHVLKVRPRSGPPWDQSCAVWLHTRHVEALLAHPIGTLSLCFHSAW